jgi:hypothetical protein
MNNDYAERQRLEIMLVLESRSAVINTSHSSCFASTWTFQVLPPEIEKGLDVMVRERFDQPRINGGVYNDAHAS